MLSLQNKYSSSFNAPVILDNVV